MRKVKTDIFGQNISEGDFVLRSGGGGGTAFIPCKIQEIQYNRLGAILRIVAVHPWWNSLGFWDWKRKLLWPSDELIRVSAKELLDYEGHREGWQEGFIKELIS